MKYVKGLDGLRAISILMVLVNHSGIDEKLQQFDFVKQHYNLISGTTGVNIFFVISGFLITQLLLQEKRKFNSVDFKLFFARRFLRLSPPLLVLLLVLFVLMISSVLPSNYSALALSFLYLYNFVDHNNYVGELGHTWSLAVEEQFYIIWPFIIGIALSAKKLIRGLLVFALVCIAVKFSYSNASLLGIEGSYLVQNYYIDRWFIPAAYAIALGALSSVLLFYYNQKMADFFLDKMAPLYLSIVLYFIQALLPFISLQIVSLLLPISISLLIVWIYFNQSHLVVKLLNFYPLAFLGKISYGVYIFQGLYLRTGPGGALDIQQYPINLLLVFVTALASYFLIEKPVLRLKSRFVRIENNLPKI